MKRLLIATMLLALAACSDDSEPKPKVDKPTTTTTTTPLHEVASTAERPSGRPISADLINDPNPYPDSTEQWVGCEELPDITTYALDGAFDTLTATVGLRTGTPEIEVRLDILVDGTRIERLELPGETPPKIDIALDKARTLQLEALRTKGECTPAEVGYLVLGNASLTRPR